MQRYSFQRPFVESYRGCQREALRLKQSVEYPIIETCDTEPREYLSRGVAYPRLEITYPTSMIEKGSVTINSDNKLWQDRSHTDIGNTMLGYSKDDVEEMISDEVCRFDYIKDGEGNNSYKLYEFPFLQTGLINLEVEVLEDSDIYLVFEEILWQEDAELKENEPLNLCFWRGECANIIKYRLKKGVYSLQSFEIHTFHIKFFCIIFYLDFITLA